MPAPRLASRFFLPALMVASGALGAMIYVALQPGSAARSATERVAQKFVSNRQISGRIARQAMAVRNALASRRALGSGPVGASPAAASGGAESLADVPEPAPEPAVSKPAWPPPAPHGFSVTPPVISSFAERVEHKAWWIGEFARRIEVYRRLAPGREYPDSDTVAEWLDELYDMAMPRGEGERWAELIARRKRRRELVGAISGGFQVPIHTILAMGNDPSMARARQ